MKKILVIVTLFIFTNLIFAPITPVNAQLNLINDDKTTDMKQAAKVVAESGGDGYDTTVTFSDILGTIVRIVLSILGTIFIVLIFVAGNDWMQAAGNEEKVKKSKAIIRNLLIGLCVILVAYALTIGMGGGVLSSILLTK